MNSLDSLRSSKSLLERLEYLNRLSGALEYINAMVAKFEPLGQSPWGKERVGRFKDLARSIKDRIAAYDPYQQRKNYGIQYEVPPEEWR